MRDATDRQSKLFAISRFLYVLLPLPVAWLSLSLMSAYLEFYDIGVNASANDGFLLWVAAPLLLVVLYGMAGVGLYLTRPMCRSRWMPILVGSGAMVALGAGAFALLVRSYLDYPTEAPQSVTTFLEHYLSDTAASWLSTR